MERRQCARSQFISVTVVATLLFARTWHPAVAGSTWRPRGRVRRLLRPRITVSGLIGSADRGAVVARRHRALDRLDLRGPSSRRRPNGHCAGADDRVASGHRAREAKPGNAVAAGASRRRARAPRRVAQRIDEARDEHGNALHGQCQVPHVADAPPTRGRLQRREAESEGDDRTRAVMPQSARVSARHSGRCFALSCYCFERGLAPVSSTAAQPRDCSRRWVVVVEPRTESSRGQCRVGSGRTCPDRDR